METDDFVNLAYINFIKKMVVVPKQPVKMTAGCPWCRETHNLIDPEVGQYFNCKCGTEIMIDSLDPIRLIDVYEHSLRMYSGV